MKRAFKTILGVLDRPPNTSRGQSLVELTLTMPIFFVMLLGLVEIGWLANNYMILVDVSREAGRYGSVRDPIENWVPGMEKTYHRMDCDELTDRFSKFPNDDPPFTSPPGPTLPGYDNGSEGPIDFYDGVACTVLTNMAPLEFDDSADDVIVSVISYAVIDDVTGPRAIVTGRYPARSNECADDVRDPFAPHFLPPTLRDPDRYDATADEGQRGYLFRGNYFTESGCRGSDFSLTEIEDTINRTMLDDSGDPITDLEIQNVPNFGIVLVEIHWTHYQLLNLPFFTWIGNPIPINVWSFFPVTAAEPTATEIP